MELTPGFQVTDKVTLLRPLGKGAMGSVWVARHATLDTDVAVKFISEDYGHAREDVLERFSREVKAASRLKSPHVVQMIDHGITEEGIPYIVMELLEGESLNDRIERAGALSPHDTLQVIEGVGKALSVAHARGVIHRDIKPQNIFITAADDGDIFTKVFDFGIAKEVHSSEELTIPGTIVGTPEYLCRDIIAAKTPQYDEQADLWSLAVVIYKCLTTQLPFQGDTLGLILAALAVGEFTPPTELRPELPERYDRWFERAFSNDPIKRFKSAAELVASFRGVVDPESVPWDERETAVRPKVEVPKKAPKRRSRWLVPLIVTVGLGAGAGATFVFRDRLRGPAPPPVVPTEPTSAVEPVDAPEAGIGGTGGAPAEDAGPSDAGDDAAAVAAAGGGKPSMEEVLIEAGNFWMGCHDDTDLICEDDETPGHEVFVDAFFIDRTEVPVRDYAECVDDNKCTANGLSGFILEGGRFGLSERCNWRQIGRDDHPINCISQTQAERYCLWRDKRLPTEAEWERAARGDDRRKFPWGDIDATCALTVMSNGCGAKGTWPVGKKKLDVSPFGVRDLGGNVREWVADWYDEQFYDSIDTDAGATRNPTGPSTGIAIVTRGGTWGVQVPRFMRASHREGFVAATRSVHLGFRCARSAP